MIWISRNTPHPIGARHNAEEMIKQLQNHFRILDGWQIRYVRSMKYSAQTTIIPDKKKATIYHWHGKNQPSDYLLHEVIHCAIRELLTRMNRKRIVGPIREAEEILVEDLCSLIVDITGRWRKPGTKQDGDIVEEQGGESGPLR